MVEAFITILNGVITGKHHGDIHAELYGTPYYGHEKRAVPFNTAIVPLEPAAFYTDDWQRKPDCQLIDEGIIPMPNGYVREGKELRLMTPLERVIAGLDEPPTGYRIAGNNLVPMTLQESLATGQITQAEHDERAAVENQIELNRRLGELQTADALALAEVDEEYALERKLKLKALLAVKSQRGWPVTAAWPE